MLGLRDPCCLTIILRLQRRMNNGKRSTMLGQTQTIWVSQIRTTYLRQGRKANDPSRALILDKTLRRRKDDTKMVSCKVTERKQAIVGKGQGRKQARLGEQCCTGTTRATNYLVDLSRQVTIPGSLRRVSRLRFLFPPVNPGKDSES